jgi:hypothetical protein
MCSLIGLISVKSSRNEPWDAAFPACGESAFQNAIMLLESLIELRDL